MTPALRQKNTAPTWVQILFQGQSGVSGIHLMTTREEKSSSTDLEFFIFQESLLES